VLHHRVLQRLRKRRAPSQPFARDLRPPIQQPEQHLHRRGRILRQSAPQCDEIRLMRWHFIGIAW